MSRLQRLVPLGPYPGLPTPSNPPSNRPSDPLSNPPLCGVDPSVDRAMSTEGQHLGIQDKGPGGDPGVESMQPGWDPGLFGIQLKGAPGVDETRLGGVQNVPVGCVVDVSAGLGGDGSLKEPNEGPTGPSEELKEPNEGPNVGPNGPPEGPKAPNVGPDAPNERPSEGPDKLTGSTAAVLETAASVQRSEGRMKIGGIPRYAPFGSRVQLLASGGTHSQRRPSPAYVSTANP